MSCIQLRTTQFRGGRHLESQRAEFREGKVTNSEIIRNSGARDGQNFSYTARDGHMMMEKWGECSRRHHHHHHHHHHIPFGGGTCSFAACLGHLTIDHASLSRPSTVPTPTRDTSNIWALITILPYITQKLLAYPIPVLFRRLRPPFGEGLHDGLLQKRGYLATGYPL